MKKIIALILVSLFAIACLTACGGNDEPKPAFEASNNGTESKPAESKPASTSSEAASEAASEDNSDASEASGDESGEESGEESGNGTEEPAKVEFTNKFVSWAKASKDGKTDVVITAPTSIALSKINEAVVAGDVGVFTPAYGKSIKSADQDYADFAVFVFEYDSATFSYARKQAYAVGKAPADVKIPSDGYVLAVYKSFDDKIKAITTYDGPNTFFPYGFVVNATADTKIKSASKAPQIDGKISSGEYGAAVWKINPQNALANYSQFEVNEYYASAEVYLTYDKDYLYVGVIVDSPYHFNNLTQDTATSMWKYECIQVNVSSNSANSAYIKEHWDGGHDATAANENVVRQYGFAVNDSDETISCVWIGSPASFGGTTVCTRDDSTKKTVYEAAIPWSECGAKDSPIKVQKGTQIGFSVSINCGSDKAEFKNITLRDGGGIIGVNDWTKVPVITLN